MVLPDHVVHAPAIQSPSVALALFVAACAPAPASPISQHVATPKLPAQPERLVTRHLAVGTALAVANRYTSELVLDGAHATLLERAEEASGAFTIERADREAKWTTTKQQIRTGPVTRTGARFSIDVAGATDSMYLSCAHRAIEVARAGAVRVANVGHELDCDDPGTWRPAALVKVDAVVCGAEDAGDDDDLMTHWFFAPASGIESVEEIDDCLHSEGLRLSSPNSGAAPRR